MELIRQPVDLSKCSNPADAATVAAIVDMVDGVGGHDAVMDLMVSRYAYKIKREVDSDGNVYNTYVRADREYAIKNGFFEIVNTGFGRGVIERRATLFSEEAQTWEYEPESVAETFDWLREDGGADIALIRADKLADSVGCSCMKVAYRDGMLAWQPFAMSSMIACYAPQIIGDGAIRATDYTSIEEATALVLTVGAVGGGKTQFEAYFGASDDYPQGRHVTWIGNSATDVPDVGSGGWDWTVDGEFAQVTDAERVANPLTWYKQTAGGGEGPEYPIVVWYGDSSRAGVELLPFTGKDFYNDSLEVDCAASILTKNALISSRGIVALKTEMGGALSNPWDQGMVHLRKGQDLSVQGVAASNSKDAWDVVQNYMRARAESRGVPGHLVVADTDGGNPQSGVSLKIQNEPMRRTRKERWRVNRHSFQRWWEVSKRVYNLGEGSEVIPLSAELKYDPGEISFPGEDDRLADAMLAKAEIDAGIVDLADAVAEFHRITREEAIAMIERNAADAEANPALAPKPAQQQPTGGLFARRP